MARKGRTITEQLRSAIKQDTRTLNAIAEDAGLPASAVTRLMAGQAITTVTLDKLAATLGLTLVATDAAPRRGKKRKKPSTSNRRKGRATP